MSHMYVVQRIISSLSWIPLLELWFHSLNIFLSSIFLVTGNWSASIDSAYSWSQLLKISLRGPLQELAQAAYGYCNFWVSCCSALWICFLDVSECLVTCINVDSFSLYFAGIFSVMISLGKNQYFMIFLLVIPCFLKKKSMIWLKKHYMDLSTVI